ncbi:MAG: hypothetical protein V7742_12500 [Halioglobus sp.]
MPLNYEMLVQTVTMPLILMGLIFCTISPSGAAEKNALADAVVSSSDALYGKLVDRTRTPEIPGVVSPSFVVDPTWPKPLPNKWIIGQVGGIAVDQDDNIWVLHRPRSLSATAVGALDVAAHDKDGLAIDGLGNPRPFSEKHAKCCVPAPSVLKFDASGTLLDSWGGPSDPEFLKTRCRADQGCVWPAREHGIFVDHNNFVYLSGNGEGAEGQFPWSATHGNDSHVLKFSATGNFIYQIGYAGTTEPSNESTNGGPGGTPQLFMPSDMTVDPQTNRLYIADGYGNSRVLVVDAKTGKYIGHFGAYGQNPVVTKPIGDSGAYGQDLVATKSDGAAPWPVKFRAGVTKPRYFDSAVHCAVVSRDGLVYVCDRNNNRIQVFRADAVGKPCINADAKTGACGFVRDIPVELQTVGPTVGGIAFSTDGEQSCLYAADLWNGMFHVIDRSNGNIVQQVGRTGRQVGQFNWLHSLTVDSRGNVYTGEVETGQRVQKFTRHGSVGCSSTGSAR